MKIRSGHVIQVMERTDLGHDDVLTPEPVIWVRLVEIYNRDRDRSVRADIFHGRYLGFGFPPRHEPASDTRNDDTAIA